VKSVTYREGERDDTEMSEEDPVRREGSLGYIEQSLFILFFLGVESTQLARQVQQERAQMEVQ